MAGRFNSQRDVDFFTTVTQELVGKQQGGKDGIINQLVTIFQIDVRETPTNMYGEASQGKFYKPGVDLNCLIEAEDFDFTTETFGPDRNQNATFAFLRQSLIDADNFVVEIGDLIKWIYAYWEISSINENQLVGGMFDQNYSAVATAFLTRLSNIQVENMRAI